MAVLTLIVNQCGVHATTLGETQARRTADVGHAYRAGGARRRARPMILHKPIRSAIWVGAHGLDLPHSISERVCRPLGCDLGKDDEGRRDQICDGSRLGADVRIAWFGPEPGLGGGVPHVSAQILSALPAAGVEVDAYIAGAVSDLRWLDSIDGVRLIREPVRWHWNRWYSRNSLLAVSSGQVARLHAQRRLVRRLLGAASRAEYDVVYQFSQFESPWSPTTGRKLPPVVVHPEVHAAGELRWHRRESDLSRQCEQTHARLAARGVLMTRAVLQRLGAAYPDAFVAPSTVFARDIERDYHIDMRRVYVVPNPVDLERFVPWPAPTNEPAAVDLVFVSRIAVRKGVDLVVALSHRLDDLAGEVRIRIVGGKGMFSDYRPLLKNLNPRVARYEGALSPGQLAALYRESGALLQPSRYEPFALTVAEALASGLPVVASDRVGAAEGVDRRVCRVFRDGDIDGFEAAVRGLLGDLHLQGRDALGAAARVEAERLFSPDKVAGQLADVFRSVAQLRV